MEVKNISYVNFGNRVTTQILMETLVGKPCSKGGYESYKQIVEELEPNHRFVGNLGFRGYATKKLLPKVEQKYPQISADAKEIRKLLKDKPNLSDIEFLQFIKKYISKYDK